MTQRNGVGQQLPQQRLAVISLPSQHFTLPRTLPSAACTHRSWHETPAGRRPVAGTELAEHWLSRPAQALLMTRHISRATLVESLQPTNRAPGVIHRCCPHHWWVIQTPNGSQWAIPSVICLVMDQHRERARCLGLLFNIQESSSWWEEASATERTWRELWGPPHRTWVQFNARRRSYDCWVPRAVSISTWNLLVEFRFTLYKVARVTRHGSLDPNSHEKD